LTWPPATALVYVDLLPGAGNELKPGMFARGEFRFDSRQVLTLPASALLLRDGFDVVMRIGPDQSHERIRLVDPQPDPGRHAVRAAHAGRADELQAP
jgi:HlyD family secretion protein